MAKVIFRQSDANSADVSILEHLVGSKPALKELRQLARLGGGFGPCRVYVMQASYKSEATKSLIVKIGPRDEILAEDEGHVLAASFVNPKTAVPKVSVDCDDSNGVLVFSYAGYSGRPPKDLYAILDRPEAVEAVRSVTYTIKEWTDPATWSKDNPSAALKRWTERKLDSLPEVALASASYKVINSPDFGESYANPAYYLRRDLPRHEVLCPTAFTHGDLNLRNILFNVTSGNAPEIDSPLLIDFRYASDEQYAITDLAKLEACLRYEVLPRIDSAASLAQVIQFLAATRDGMTLATTPEAISDKRLQELWRCIGIIREAVHGILRKEKESAVCYWATLAAYAISASTYTTLPAHSRNLAYLDGAALLTDHICPRDVVAAQKIISVHDSFSPQVQTEAPPVEEYRHLPLLLDAIRENRVAIVVGPGYGKTSGVESIHAFLHHIHQDLTGGKAPDGATPLLLDIIGRKSSRQDILRAIRERTSKWGPASAEADDLLMTMPRAVFMVHFHCRALEALRSSGKAPSLIRADSVEAATANFDELAGGANIYVPLYGDVESNPGGLILNRADRKQQEKCLELVSKALSRQGRPFALAFWKCEELAVGDVHAIREQVAAELSVPLDSYYITDMDSAPRDASLADVGILRIRRTLHELALMNRASGSTSAPVPLVTTNQWRSGNDIYVLPDISRQSRGLMYFYGELGNVAGSGLQNQGASYLLGGSPTESDIQDHRVVKRHLIENEVLPAVRKALGDHSQRVRPIVLCGRPGAGVSTVLCYTAHVIDRLGLAPVLVVARPATRTAQEWKEAGALIADISRTTRRPVVVICEAHETTRRDIEALAEAAVESHTDIVLITGGRRDLIDATLDVSLPQAIRIDVSDSLRQDEWTALASILQKNGFGLGKLPHDLAEQLAHAKYLLPAIYEATDKLNRKFGEIVAHEYRRYDADTLVQRAYRVICCVGWLGHAISQFWLLKALGDYGLNDAVRILGQLSDDIVVEKNRAHFGAEDVVDTWISPRHRIIAEEVLKIAASEPTYRLVDVKDLVVSANLASLAEGNVVANMLSHKGVLSRWIADVCVTRKEREVRIVELYEVAVRNSPMHPKIEVYIRQHYALTLRSLQRFDDALNQAKKADGIESWNPATTHILGLVHEARALASWRAWVESGCASESELGVAQTSEEDALEFFRAARENQPRQEYGFESEARYYAKKFEALTRGKFVPHVPLAVSSKARLQIFEGLWLLGAAQRGVPKDRLIESPRTHARLLKEIGDRTGAIQLLREQIRTEQDPVRAMQLQRALIAVLLEDGKLGEVVSVSKKLIKEGDHAAILYLMLDDALVAAKAAIGERDGWLRESADEWNRRDIETLLRSAEVRLCGSDWKGAADSLRRADEAAKVALTAFQREEVRGHLKVSPYSFEERWFSGKIERTWKPYEGEVVCSELPFKVFFTVPRDFGKVSVGQRVEFVLAWRIRGLRAMRMRPLK